MSEIRHLLTGAWRRYGRPDISPSPTGGSGYGNTPYGTAPYGD